MSTASKTARGASRSARRRKERAKNQRRGFPVFGAIVAGIVVLFAITFLLTSSDTETDPQTGPAQTGATTVSGDSLPDLDPADDAAVGMTIPQVEGTDFEGSPVAIADDGRPKLIMFLAHWCPHCQAEVPIVQAWLDANGFPEGIDLYSVSTSVDEMQPNFPASDWLDREGWSVPVLRDDAANSVAAAFGVNGFPFFAFVDANGEVVERASGELPIETIETSLDKIR
jgi:thiol-disulfide isomerase/thioredoxin